MGLKIISYNVNGLRAAIRKGLIEWIAEQSADIICLQETKATKDVVDMTALNSMGYNDYWFSASKKGYSGVAILSRIKPDSVIYGMDDDRFDLEGRVIRADFGEISVISAYFPSGTTGQLRQTVKMEFLQRFNEFVVNLLKTRPMLIISGDYNICHKAIDIHNPISNKNSSGFLPEEREWVSEFIESGFIDTFRAVNQEPHQYTWWSLRTNARERNLGWRIDYQMVSKALADRIGKAYILPEAKHSDHCPVVLELS